ncbi:hypothetical protein [Photobacterium galatheae]|nr:hypothetical protein [Photobacterium galatheae]MCM0149002.1 hypothetical protein [Photobacterium galatheae]
MSTELSLKDKFLCRVYAIGVVLILYLIIWGGWEIVEMLAGKGWFNW